MKNVDMNKPTIMFGIGFRKYKTPSGNITNDLLNIEEELSMYKKINKKLETDTFIKTELGIKSNDMSLEQDNYVEKSTALRYKDETGEYFFDNNNINLRGVQKRFIELRKNFNKLFKD